MISYSLLLICGLILLVLGANWLVHGCSSLARKYGVSELIIGLTVVGFGTSMPELLVNVLASINGEASGIVLGNVIGSNNFNLLFIIGVSGLVAPLAVQGTTVWKEIPISFLAVIMILALANDQFLHISNTNTLSRLDGCFLIVLFAVFLFYIFRAIKADKHLHHEPGHMHGTTKMVAMILAGLVVLIAGGKLMVDNAVNIAQHLKVNDKIIGLTIVSAGTSLPELVTTIVAARKGKSDLAVGNIIGSNIFNIFLILGISTIIRPVNYNLDFNIDSLVLIIGTTFLFIAMFTGKKGKVDRWEALLMLVAYIVYIWYTINVD